MRRTKDIRKPTILLDVNVLVDEVDKNVFLKILNRRRIAMLPEIFGSRIQGDLEFADLLDRKPFTPRLEEGNEDVRLPPSHVQQPGVCDHFDLNRGILLVKVRDAP